MYIELAEAAVKLILELQAANRPPTAEEATRLNTELADIRARVRGKLEAIAQEK